jgi:pimeloyl-ACP methyl ester carboxylesterase
MRSPSSPAGPRDRRGGSLIPHHETALREPSEGFLEVPGGRLHYLDWGGEGREAHFLHGNGFCAGTYSPFIRLLAPGLHVIASDVRGHGASEMVFEGPVRSWGVFAEDLNTLIRATAKPPVVGLGHSLGAVTTAMAAARYPELFSAIVLIDPVFLPPRILMLLALLRAVGLKGRIPRARAARRRRKAFKGKTEALRLFLAGRGIFKRWSPEFVEAYLECGLLERDAESAVLTCDPELEAQIFESVPLSVWHHVRKISCPTLAIRGEQSDVFHEQAAERLKRLLPSCELVNLNDTGHFPPMEKPHECAAAILEFVERNAA